MPDRVEAEGPEARRFLGALRDILVVPKAGLGAKVKRQERRQQKRGRAQKTKGGGAA